MPLALAQALALLHDQAQEFVVHRGHHVNPLGTAAVVTGVHAGSQPGAVGGPVQVRIGTDDHGVIAAQLEGAGDELAGAGFRHLASGGHAAGEGNLVHTTAHDRGASLAIAQ